MNLKEKIIPLLKDKHSKIWEIIITNIDLFDENELNQIYLIIHQNDIEKLKELYLYNTSKSKNILDRILNLAKELNHIEKHVEEIKNKEEEKSLDDYLNSNLNYSIS